MADQRSVTPRIVICFENADENNPNLNGKFRVTLDLLNEGSPEIREYLEADSHGAPRWVTSGQGFHGMGARLEATLLARLIAGSFTVSEDASYRTIDVGVVSIPHVVD